MNFFYKVGSQYKIIGHAWGGQTVLDCNGCIKRENGGGSKKWVISENIFDVSFKRNIILGVQTLEKLSELVDIKTEKINN